MVRKRSNRKILSKKYKRLSKRSKRLSRKQRRLTKTKKYKRLSRINKQRLSRKSKRKKKNKKEKIKKRGGMLGHGKRRCPGGQCRIKKVPVASFKVLDVGTLATSGTDPTFGEGPTKEDQARAEEYLKKVAAPAPASSPASDDAAERELTPEQEKFKSDVNEKLGIIFKDVEKSEWLNELKDYHDLLEKGKHEVGEIIYKSQNLDDLYKIPKELHGNILEWIDLIKGMEEDKKLLEEDKKLLEEDKKLLDAVKKYEEMLGVDDTDPQKNELKTESYYFVMEDGTIQTFHDLISKSRQLRTKKNQARKIIDHFDEILPILLNHRQDRDKLKNFLSKQIVVGSTEGGSKSEPILFEVARNQFLKITGKIRITIPINMLFELLRETEDDNGKLELIKKIRENGFPILELFTLLEKLNKVQELFDKLPPESRNKPLGTWEKIRNDTFVDELMEELSYFFISVTGEAPGGRGKHADDALINSRISGLKPFITNVPIDKIDKTGLLIYLRNFEGSPTDRLSENFDKLIKKYELFSKKKNMITYEVTVDGVVYHDIILNSNFDNLSNVIDRINILVRYNTGRRRSLKKPSSVKVTYEDGTEQEIKVSHFESKKDIKDKSFKINFESEEESEEESDE